MIEHFEVIVVGAGLSGIGAGYHLQTRCPDRNYVILESRDRLGGTWDLFRYPGIRSDSDMHTLGYAFRPWTDAKAIANGGAILDYIAETAREHGVDRHIRYRSPVTSAAWSSEDACWTVEVGDGTSLTCNFLYLCAGYYDYSRGHAPVFTGEADFAGRIVHPQFWPDDLDYTEKRVVVIGSGATAVTLVPELAKRAAHVTMLQRSPTYIVSRPSRDRIADKLRKILPARVAYGITRWKNVSLGLFFYKLARSRPTQTKTRIVEMARAELGPDYDLTHITPKYNPWDQRLCLVPDADLFAVLRSGHASIVTDTVERFEAGGIRVSSGRLLEADVIVLATGLSIKMLGGIALTMDGASITASGRLAFRGMMLEGVPNLALCFGYTNASWTLKADLTSKYVCRLLNAMRRRGWRECRPTRDAVTVVPKPFVDFTSGYIARAAGELPVQGDRAPWRLHQNYLLDILTLRFGSIRRGMRFR